MQLDLTGKRAVVPASSSGLGYAIAMELARHGARVAISSRDEGRIAAAAASIIEATGAEVSHRVCDVRDDAALETWIDAAATAWGGLDIVVHNSGGPPAGSFADFSLDDWEGAYRLLLESAIRVAGASRPHLGPGSALVFMTSMSVRRPGGNLILSSVFRAGVAALAKSLAAEWAPDVRVNHVIPGRIATERVAELDAYAANQRGIATDEMAAEMAATIPMGRYGDPEEYARAVSFLASDAASYLTGATLQIDGGALVETY
ncbi:MAG: SDR family oxidoreductase [Acidimicrobiia bacterium]|nr:SDR family oxidoreductase [Acidimicrobiia bacterium]MBT8214500.1 SDR family oxidoreductase [Acidimicrobiia bacterium]NNF68798.1 SDR family oxidoreductase [Acidimicrobiia bacterium]